jgi:ABC-2 type transport system ATP-binding protein
VFLTTHYLEEADALCDRIMIIDGGRIVAQGAPESLKRDASGDTVTLSLPSAEDAITASRALTASLRSARALSVDGRTVQFKLPSGGESLPALFDLLRDSGVHLAGVEVRRPSLDDVFLTLTGRALRDDTPAA